MVYSPSKVKEWTASSAMEQALRLLGPRALSTVELRRKLSQRGVPSELIQTTEETWHIWTMINWQRTH